MIEFAFFAGGALSSLFGVIVGAALIQSSKKEH